VVNLKYIKVMNIMEKKEEIKDRFMNPLITEQKMPLLPGQRKLSDY